MRSGNTGSCTVLVVCAVGIVELGADVRSGNTGSCTVLIGCADKIVVCIDDSFLSTVVVTVKLSTVLSWSINIWIKSLPGNGLRQKLRLLLQTSLVLVLPLLC